MNLTVLGCAGGIGGRESFTTSLLVDDDILIDAGTGVGQLRVDDLARIEHVVLTHSHVDHLVGLAFLADAVIGRRDHPVTVHGSAPVIDALQRHLFNWILWPDFTRLPTPERPTLRWSIAPPFVPLSFHGRTLTPFPVNHTVDGVAYFVTEMDSGFLFTGDMATTPELWAALAAEPRVRMVLVDCSFPDDEAAIAEASRHFCPRTLLADIRHVPHDVEFLITHLKPGSEDTILGELREHGAGRSFHALTCGDRFTF